MEENRLTLHICTMNRPAELYGLLVSLREQVFKQWDLILVDQSNPAISSYHFIMMMLNQLKVDGHKVIIRASENKGIVPNRNQAFKLQEEFFPEAKFSVRLDDDSIADKHLLLNLYQSTQRRDKVGAVGCLVPVFGLPPYSNNISNLPNELFDQVLWEDGKVSKITDNGGELWKDYGKNPKALLPTHHLRSSFLINNAAAKEVGYYDTAFQSSAFREETDFCLKLLRKGYNLFINTNAILWHCRGGGGGLRALDPNTYNESVQRCNIYFNDKWQLIYEIDENFRKVFE